MKAQSVNVPHSPAPIRETCPHDISVTTECARCEALPPWQHLGIDPVVVRLTDLLSEPDDIQVIDTPDGLALHRVTVAKLAHRIAGDRGLTTCYAARFDDGDGDSGGESLARRLSQLGSSGFIQVRSEARAPGNDAA